jgi:hypothetical protein
MKSRRMGLAEMVARMGEKISAYKVLVWKPKKEDQDVGVWIILKCELWYGPVEGSCEYGNEHSVTIEFLEFFE